MRRDAAVLVPVFRDEEGELALLVVRRAEGGIHGGQLAFPGGRRDPADESLLATALRETEEEVGIRPESVEVLAELPPVRTLTTRIRVHPFLGRLHETGGWSPCEREIAEILTVRLRDLTSPGTRGEAEATFSTWPKPRLVSYLRVGPYRLWGLTLRILDSLMPRLLRGDYEI